MEQTPNDQKPRVSFAGYLWPLVLGIGTAIGIGIGAAIGRIGAGVGIGVGIGVLVGLILYRRFSRKTSNT